MNNLFINLFELNIALLILYVPYKLFFERDKNFIIRRIYLLGVIILPFIILLVPEGAQVPVGSVSPFFIRLDEISVFGQNGANMGRGLIAPGNIPAVIYFSILLLGFCRLCTRLVIIFRAIYRSGRLSKNGTPLLSNPKFHASSFFGYIFIDPAIEHEDTFNHILEHENIHKKGWHSIDRILAELFVIINWFNPLAWLLRKSVIENLEYLADSAVVQKGTDRIGYQLSILNQYIGSASITNQFSSQIKNRINMLNRDYKTGSTWKIAMILPIVLITFLFVSCTEKDTGGVFEDENVNESTLTESKIYQHVDEMPSFQGNEPLEFRRFIAQHIIYPEEARDNGVTGKVFVVFVVRRDGKVVIPEAAEIPPSPDSEKMDEVVVVSYRPLDEEASLPDEKHIELLKNEAVRVVTSSPDWEPGKVDGKPVDVMFTFPINFVLQ